MAPDQKILTYRVRQLPLEIDEAGVISAFQRHLQVDTSLPEVRVYSLARDLSSLHTSRTMTATVTIMPLSLELKRHKEWTFRMTYRGSEYSIIVDVHFLDFTVLNEVHDEEHVLDCIAISGLGSHPFGSWQHRGEDPFMWLRDSVPHDLPSVRSIIYGYDSQVPDSDSFQRPHDIAVRLVNRLRSVGFGASHSRPLIFLAHSLGGIILKEVLVILAGISDQPHSILGNLKLVVFFGTPHKGMSTERLIYMVKNQPNEDLVRDLSLGSSYLLHVEKRFNGVQTRREFRVVSFFETKTTKTVKQNQDGTWSRTGLPVRMVDRESAIQLCSHDPEDIYGINEDHSAMVKFSLDDANYRCVQDCFAKVLSTVKVNYAKHLRRNDRNLEGQRSKWKRDDANPNAGPSSAFPMDGPANHKMPSASDIISSLRLEILDRRLTEISSPYRSTLDWIFGESALGFTTWLLKGQGAYWIKGKPGSGKSTLMKHIAEHQYTHDFLLRWSHPSTLVKAGFFFYYRGSKIQKSFNGLVRSVLLQIMEVAPEVCQFVPRKCFPPSGGTEYNWSPSNLYDALQSVLEQQQQSIGLKLCFFIDALDEFDGHLELLADFLEGLIKRGCKVCFSSRPRDILERYFGGFPGIKIHEHTETDIQNYTLMRLASISGLQNPSPPSREMRDAVSRATQEISRKANGVFLWVRLALDRIEQEGLPIHRLPELLQELPEELEDFYASIIERIPQEFRWETYLTLDVMLRTREEPLLLHIFWITKWAHCETLEECAKKLGEKRDFARFCYRLKERCGGLIEISEPFNVDDRIRLMHETVREFIGTPGFQELVAGREALFRAQNGYTEFAKLLLVAQKYPSDVDLNRFHDTYGLQAPLMSMIYCHLAESTTGVCQLKFIDALQPCDFERLQKFSYIRNAAPYQMYPAPSSALSFGISAGLLIYMQQKLLESEALDSIVESGLHLVVENVLFKVRNKGSISRHNRGFNPDDSQMARLLLGGRERSRDLDATAFGSLLLAQSGFSGAAYGLKLKSTVEKVHRSKRVLELARIFLDNGQNPNMEMIAEPWFETRRCGNPNGPRPLHVALDQMAKLLLNYNAEANARDRCGRTPLDVALQRLELDRRTMGDPWTYQVKTVQSLLADHIDMLMERGACITRQGFELYPSCVEAFRDSHRDLKRLLELPRRSMESGFLSQPEPPRTPRSSRVESAFGNLVKRLIRNKELRTEEVGNKEIQYKDDYI